VPVATVAIGKAGARNAAILAVQILALSTPKLRQALELHKSKQAESVDKKGQSLKGRLCRD
jgi:5-(carboxyamino)imidazole ribonucleotide mutase